MKRRLSFIAVTLLGGLFSTSILAQKTDWDSTYRPGNFARKVAQFKSYPHSQNDVVFLGNSITDYNNWNELLQMPYAKNRGISGDITFGVLERLDEVIEGKPSKVFILIGINDISRNIPEAVILQNHKRILQRIKQGSPRTQIFLQTLLPVNNEVPGRTEFNKFAQILKVNEGLKKLAAEEKVTLIDLFSHFSNTAGKLEKRFTYDGLHLNAEGYLHWVPLIREYAKPTRFMHPAFNKEGHRGIRGLSPENTIPSMYLAMDYGVNTLEVDVVISKDKKVVVSHDVFFHQDFSTTPDGKTLTPAEAQLHHLYKMNYDSIRKYDVGLKPHPAFPQQQKIATYKPLLAELIDSVDAYAKKTGKPIYYNIELKLNRDYDNVHQPTVNEMVELVMEVVRSRKIEDRCYLQSFDFRPLQILHQQYPDIETAVLIGVDKRSLAKQIEDLGYIPGIYSPHYSVVTAELIKECHQMGMRIIPWTVNTKEEIKKLKEMGVDGIITDYANYFTDDK
ncbi:MAG: GDSL-type esterase/lipase family protein [Chitinophagaceae bacterium]|nr:GDSL-type esterase/lipase family protein [Chitinophagaceae bacterium]